MTLVDILSLVLLAAGLLGFILLNAVWLIMREEGRQVLDEDQIQEAVDEGFRLYGRMLDLDDAHVEDAVRAGLRAAVESALSKSKVREDGNV